MIFKSEIVQAYTLQQENLHHPATYTILTYLQKMVISKSHVEVIFGIRRCWKSKLLKQLMLTYSNYANLFPKTPNYCFGSFAFLFTIWLSNLRFDYNIIIQSSYFRAYKDLQTIITNR